MGAPLWPPAVRPRVEPRRRGPPVAPDRAARLRPLEPRDRRRRLPPAQAGRAPPPRPRLPPRLAGPLPLRTDGERMSRRLDGGDPGAQVPARPAPERATAFGPHLERDACGIGFVADASGRASGEIVDCLLEGLHNVQHRGATAADGRTGDGAGVLLPLRPGGPGLAMVFLRDESAREAIEAACRAEGIETLGWREVPVDPTALGAEALESMPRIEQLLLAGGDETAAFRARRRAE